MTGWLADWLLTLHRCAAGAHVFGFETAPQVSATQRGRPANETTKRLLDSGTCCCATLSMPGAVRPRSSISPPPRPPSRTRSQVYNRPGRWVLEFQTLSHDCHRGSIDRVQAQMSIPRPVPELAQPNFSSTRLCPAVQSRHRQAPPASRPGDQWTPFSLPFMTCL